MSTKKVRIVEMLLAGATYAQIVQEVGCAKSTISYHAKSLGLSKLPSNLSTNYAAQGYKTTTSENGRTRFHCVWCGRIAKSRRKYCSKACFSKKLEADRLESNWSGSKAVSRFRQRQKMKAVEHKGGKCALCGYDKCAQALHFHHLDPATKAFGLSSQGLTRSWTTVKTELDKCILLCANCHAEVHAGVVELPS